MLKPEKAAVRSPERAALTEAIAASAEAEARVSETRAAIPRAKEALAAARTKVEDAETNLARARGETAKGAAVAALHGAVLGPGLAMKAARERLAEAQDELEVAREALALLEETLAEQERSQKLACEGVERAATQVLLAPLPQFLAEARELHGRLTSVRLALRFFQRRLPERNADLDRLLSFEAFPRGLGFVEFANWDNHDDHQAWARALAALLRDADALLPHEQ